MTALSAVTCPVCGAPFNKIENNCPYCGVLVVIKSDHHRIDATKLNRSVINERIHEYRQALKKDRDDATAHYGLGVAYFNLGLLDESIDELSEASRIMPENPHIQAQLGVVLNEVGRKRGGDYTEHAWKRVERALMLDPENEDALVLREDLLKQRLRASIPYPAARATARQQLVETWRTLANVDEERARPLVVHFLRQNEEVIRSLPKWRYAIAQESHQKPKGTKWFWRSLGLAVLSFIAVFIVSIVAAVMTPEVDDSLDLSSVAGIIFVISFVSWFVVPVAVLILGYIRSRPRRTDPNVPSLRKPDVVENLLEPATPIGDQINAASEILTAVDESERRDFAQPSSVRW